MSTCPRGSPHFCTNTHWIAKDTGSMINTYSETIFKVPIFSWIEWNFACNNVCGFSVLLWQVWINQVRTQIPASSPFVRTSLWETAYSWSEPMPLQVNFILRCQRWEEMDDSEFETFNSPSPNLVFISNKSCIFLLQLLIPLSYLFFRWMRSIFKDI